MSIPDYKIHPWRYDIKEYSAILDGRIEVYHVSFITGKPIEVTGTYNCDVCDNVRAEGFIFRTKM